MSDDEKLLLSARGIKIVRYLGSGLTGAVYLGLQEHQEWPVYFCL